MQVQSPDPYSCWMSSGIHNFSEQYTDTYHWIDPDGGHWSDPNGGRHECSHPCLGATLAETWETERDLCMRGKVSKAACAALTSRGEHVLSCCCNTCTALIAAPACCFVGTVLSAGAGGVAGLINAAVPCFTKCSEEAANQARKDSKEMKDYALHTFSYCSTWTLGLIGTCAADILTLPINLTCPEVSNRFCFQQERNFWINKKMKNYPCLPSLKRRQYHNERIEQESLLTPPPQQSPLNSEPIREPID